jgi:hypothetical protein
MSSPIRSAPAQICSRRAQLIVWIVGWLEHPLFNLVVLKIIKLHIMSVTTYAAVIPHTLKWLSEYVQRYLTHLMWQFVHPRGQQSVTIFTCLYVVNIKMVRQWPSLTIVWLVLTVPLYRTLPEHALDHLQPKYISSLNYKLKLNHHYLPLEMDSILKDPTINTFLLSFNRKDYTSTLNNCCLLVLRHS